MPADAHVLLADAPVGLADDMIMLEKDFMELEKGFEGLENDLHNISWQNLYHLFEEDTISFQKDEWKIREIINKKKTW